MSEVVQYLSVEDVKTISGWSTSYVRKRASLDKWRRLGSRPQKYRMADVLGSVKAHRDTRVRKHLLEKYVGQG